MGGISGGHASNALLKAGPTRSRYSETRQVFTVSKNGDPPGGFSGPLIQCLTTFILNFSPLRSNQNFPSGNLSLLPPVSCHHASLGKVWLCLFCTLPLGSCTEQPLNKTEQPNSHSLSSSCWPLLDSFQFCCLSCIGEPKSEHHTPKYRRKVLRGAIPSFNLHS